MGRAIAIVSLIVLCSFGFVLLQLWMRRPTGAAAAVGPTPVLETRDDGSVYAVSLRLSRFEQRLMDEERRSQQLLADLDGLRQERDRLRQQVLELQGELHRLRLEVAPAPPAEPSDPNVNGPGANVPGPPVPVVPTEPGQ